MVRGVTSAVAGEGNCKLKIAKRKLQNEGRKRLAASPSFCNLQFAMADLQSWLLAELARVQISLAGDRNSDEFRYGS
jgi:hypothetical protein